MAGRVDQGDQKLASEYIGGLRFYREGQSEGRRSQHFDALQVLQVVLVEGEEVGSALLRFSLSGEVQSCEEALLLGDCPVDEVLRGQLGAQLPDGAILGEVD